SLEEFQILNSSFLDSQISMAKILTSPDSKTDPNKSQGLSKVFGEVKVSLGLKNSLS
ncbi:hypothetical protein CLV31_1261, partial [Algoriphagus aquaeductus]